MRTELQQKIDQVYIAREARLAMQKTIDKAYEEEQRLLEEIKIELMDSNTEFLQTDVARVSLKHTMEPEVVNWHEFQDYIKRTGQLDLLQKRPMVSAIKARWEEALDVPGVTRIEGVKITVGAAK